MIPQQQFSSDWVQSSHKYWDLVIILVDSKIRFWILRVLRVENWLKVTADTKAFGALMVVGASAICPSDHQELKTEETMLGHGSTFLFGFSLLFHVSIKLNTNKNIHEVIISSLVLNSIRRSHMRFPFSSISECYEIIPCWSRISWKSFHQCVLMTNLRECVFHYPTSLSVGNMVDGSLPQRWPAMAAWNQRLSLLGTMGNWNWIKRWLDETSSGRSTITLVPGRKTRRI